MPVITVENLSKKYVIGRQPNGYRTLRDVLTESLAKPVRAVRSLAGGQSAQYDAPSFRNCVRILGPHDARAEQAHQPAGGDFGARLCSVQRSRRRRLCAALDSLMTDVVGTIPE